MKLTNINKQLWDVDINAPKIEAVSEVKKKLWAQNILEGTTGFTVEQFDARLLWSQREQSAAQPWIIFIHWTKVSKGNQIWNKESAIQLIDSDVEKWFQESEFCIDLRERIVFDAPFGAKIKQSCMFSMLYQQTRSAPREKNTSRTWSNKRVDWNDITKFYKTILLNFIYELADF